MIFMERIIAALYRQELNKLDELDKNLINVSFTLIQIVIIIILYCFLQHLSFHTAAIYGR